MGINGDEAEWECAGWGDEKDGQRSCGISMGGTLEAVGL